MGCIEWQRDGPKVPDIVREATDEYLADQDTVGQWIDASTEADVNNFEKTRDLFGSWKLWCEPRNQFVGTETAFADVLKDRGYKHERSKQARGFSGLRLKFDAESTHREPWDVHG